MKRIITLLTISILTLASYGQKVYVTKYQSEANYKVFVVKYKSEADVIIRIVDKVYKAKNNYWYFVEHSYQSDIKIYFVKYKSQSTLKIYYEKK
jgi:hypothetical protein